MSKQWRIYCLDPQDIGWKYVWSDTPITECPNDNTHSVKEDSVSIYNEEIECFSKSFAIERLIKSKHFYRILTLLYTRKKMGKIRTIKIIFGKLQNVDKVTLEIFNKTQNRSEHKYTVSSNVIIDTVINFGAADKILQDNDVIEINIKCENITNSKNSRFAVSYISIYTDPNSLL